MRDSEVLVLVGPMGVGKTTVGKKLAKALGLPFVDTDSIVVMLGGVPLGEKLLMWWNFIAREHNEIVEMRRAWNAREERFGEFADRIGGWIPAPELPNVELRPR